jgi:hypothetical protein
MGLFRKRDAHQTELQVWTVVNMTPSMIAYGNTMISEVLGEDITPEHERLNFAALDAAREFNRAFDAKEWNTLGNQNAAWNAAMGELNAHLEANGYKDKFAALETAKVGA